MHRLLDGREARVGVLVGNPASDESDAPIAIVCEFNHAVSAATLKETHRLAWNFCRSPLLVTAEPHLVRAWSCYETPDPDLAAPFDIDPIEEVNLDQDPVISRAAAALDWVQLASGQFFVKHADRFIRDKRADRTLLENLRFVQRELTIPHPKNPQKAIPEDIAHDLLARIIFIQFLFDRKDSTDKAALNESVLDNLHKTGVLSQRYSRLSEILESKSDTYDFFHWLDQKFNGDLFPGKDPATSSEEQEDAWERETRFVTQKHLNRLAAFVSGRVEIAKGQMSLWPLYSFDTIPLEFISSIYEEFVSNRANKKGQHYTPGYLVDFVLDKVLPWHGQEWDLRILDPACGSGIFLVKAFQRLAYRWRNTHPGEEPPAAFLRGLLEKNLFGVDIDSAAVRVASFSLYLAMCDEIDPRHYWKQVKFPRLRNRTLTHADFFQEDIGGFQTEANAGQYDLIIGNAPWGANSLTPHGRKWADDPTHHWATSNNQGGTLFLSKGAMLSKEPGKLCLIQPASALLFNRNSTALKFRQQLFLRYTVEEIVNLSAIRFDLFPKAISPACIVTLSPRPPENKPLAYWCPKQHHTGEGGHRIIIDAHDLNWIYPEEASADPWVWTALAWGGRRDHALIRRMKSDTRRKTLETVIKERKGWFSSKGFNRCIDNVKVYEDRLQLRVLEDHDVWNDCPVVCDAKDFPANSNPLFERPRDLSLFQLPKLIMKQSWTVDDGRFKAVLVGSHDGRTNHLLFSQSFIGVSAPDTGSLAALTLVLNSIFAVYFFFLTGGRASSYRPTLLKEDLEQIPVPSDAIDIQELAEMDAHDIDESAFKMYGLKEVERVLVEDFYEITLQDFKGQEDSPGRQPVPTGHDDPSERMLTEYSNCFLNVLHAGFGQSKRISATIFQPNEARTLPYCLVAFHLDWPDRKRVVIERVHDHDLLDRLHQLDLDDTSQQTDPTLGNIFYRRVARVYQSTLIEGQPCPTVYVIKPNLVRYWSRSAAFRDADEVAADILAWGPVRNANPKQDTIHA